MTENKETKPKHKPGDEAWGTKKELEWIETIGDTVNKEPKIKFLEGYIKSFNNRVQWCEGSNKIDKDLCLKRAQELLGVIRNGY